MYFSWKDCLLTAVSVLLIVALGVGAVVLASPVLSKLPLEFRGLAKVALFLFSVFLLFGLYPRLLRAICPYREGRFELDDSAFIIFWKYHQFTYDWTMSIFGYILPVGTRALFYRFLGARLGRGVMIGGKLIEPTLIEMGGGSFAGENSVLTAHAIESGSLTLKRIVVGKNCTIGVMAIVFPGVTIGDNSIVAAGSVVTKDTEIGPGEIWGGVPARKIADRPPQA